MSTVTETVDRILEEQGGTQTWVARKMNDINPDLKMDAAKLSAIVTGNRKMSGDELVAFCHALEISPDEFMPEKAVWTGGGTSYTKKTRSQLTKDGRAHAYSDGCLESGTNVTVKQVKTVGSDIWVKIPSGWIAAYYQGSTYVK